jgi:iron(III) transport system substrate-binding protein
MLITRRAAVTGLGAMSLGLMSQSARAQMAEIEAAARKEGAVTWYTAHTDGESAEQAGAAFTKLYPEIKCTVIRTTAQVAYQRLQQDLKNNSANCDVFSSTDLGHDETLKARGNFLKYTPINLAGISPDYLGLDKDGFYHATVAELCVLLANTKRVTDAETPKVWKDLLDPRWKGQVTVGHPGFSGTVGTWVVVMRDTYGWKFFEDLERGKPQIGRSVNDSVTTLNSGERLVAMGPVGLAKVSAARGNPIRVTYPTDGSVIVVSPSAIMTNAPHHNAAKLFMEFLCGPQHAEVMAAAGRAPVRPTSQGSALPDGKILRPTTQQIVKGIPEVIEQWRDLFGN